MKAFLSLSIMFCKGGAKEVLKITMIHANHVHILTINFALNKASQQEFPPENLRILRVFFEFHGGISIF